jgi:hypothetical protein
MFLCEGDLKSFTSPAFLLNGRTIALGNVCSNELIVQVHLYGVYLIDAVSGRRIQQLIIGDEFQQLVISQARILDNYVLLLLNNQTVQLLVANETEKQITIEIPQLYSPSSNFPQFEQSVSNFQELLDLIMYIERSSDSNSALQRSNWMLQMFSSN